MALCVSAKLTYQAEMVLQARKKFLECFRLREYLLLRKGGLTTVSRRQSKSLSFPNVREMLVFKETNARHKTRSSLEAAPSFLHSRPINQSWIEAPPTPPPLALL